MGDICEAGVCPAAEVITGHGNGKRKPREMKEEGLGLWQPPTWRDGYIGRWMSRWCWSLGCRR
jgi:hypothetical protein